MCFLNTTKPKSPWVLTCVCVGVWQHFLQLLSVVDILHCQVGLRWGNNSQKEKRRGVGEVCTSRSVHPLKGKTQTALYMRRVIGVQICLGQPAKTAHTDRRINTHTCREIYTHKQQTPNKGHNLVRYPWRLRHTGGEVWHNAKKCLSSVSLSAWYSSLLFWGRWRQPRSSFKHSDTGTADVTEMTQGNVSFRKTWNLNHHPGAIFSAFAAIIFWNLSAAVLEQLQSCELIMYHPRGHISSYKLGFSTGFSKDNYDGFSSFKTSQTAFCYIFDDFNFTFNPLCCCVIVLLCKALCATINTFQ